VWVIPAYNEAESITETLEKLYDRLLQSNIPHEIVVVNDNSKDKTLEVLEGLQLDILPWWFIPIKGLTDLDMR
jgi:dolichol-phosphate mannosyltransferase